MFYVYMYIVVVDAHQVWSARARALQQCRCIPHVGGVGRQSVDAVARVQISAIRDSSRKSALMCAKPRAFVYLTDWYETAVRSALWGSLGVCGFLSQFRRMYYVCSIIYECELHVLAYTHNCRRVFSVRLCVCVCLCVSP